MESENAVSEPEDATPIFTAFRRGYDPDQVERYVADQRRRLDESTLRASEAERKLAAAVGQLRELHRRVAALESTERTDQVPAIDAIGGHIQRILQDAWDGAHSMRQSAEHDAGEIREKATQEADGIVAKAHTRAEAVGAELARRRQGVLQHIEQERSKAVAQTTFLQGQRKLALTELKKIRSLIDATIVEFTEAPITAANPPSYVAEFTSGASAPKPPDESGSPASESTTHSTPTRQELDAVTRRHPASQTDAASLHSTMQVHRLSSQEPQMEHDPSSLVRSHRELRSEEPQDATVHDFDPERRRQRPSLFDFEAREDT